MTLAYFFFRPLRKKPLKAWPFAALLVLFVVSACSGLQPMQADGPQQRMVFAAAPVDREILLQRLAPVFVVQGATRSYNCIGTARAELDAQGNERIFIDPSSATVYAMQRTFVTEHGTYRNLIYRTHFPWVPFSLLPFYLNAGDNGGLLIIVTVDANDTPLLVTTVHTCGCFVAFFPTSLLPASEYPSGWNTAGQTVYGVALPGLLPLEQGTQDDMVPVVTVSAGVHCVVDLALRPRPEIVAGSEDGAVRLAPMEELDNLPLADGFTSFFYDEGGAKGYVKGSSRPLERLLMSWWAFDWRIGEDKRYDPAGVAGPRFFTSLKFWQRDASNMNDFARFLRYWGWGL